MTKARLVKRNAQTETATVEAKPKRQMTVEEIRAQWLAERKQTATNTAALRRKLFGR